MQRHFTIRTCRLGDIIHHLQYCIRYANLNNTDIVVVSKKYCNTCKRHSWPATELIYNLLDCDLSHVKITNEKESNVRYQKVRPIMLKEYGRFDYIRAKGVDHDERSGSVVFFSASGPHAFEHRWRKALMPSEYEPLIEELEPPIFNIGDLPVDHPRVLNVPDLDLLEKFTFLNRAQIVYGVDTGLAHLASLTKTPTKIFYPLDRDPAVYLPTNDNIEILPAELPPLL